MIFLIHAYVRVTLIEFNMLTCLGASPLGIWLFVPRFHGWLESGQVEVEDGSLYVGPGHTQQD